MTTSIGPILLVKQSNTHMGITVRDCQSTIQARNISATGKNAIMGNLYRRKHDIGQPFVSEQTNRCRSAESRSGRALVCASLLFIFPLM